MTNDKQLKIIFQDRFGNQSSGPRFGYRKYEVLEDGKLRTANRRARRQRAKRGKK